MFARIHGTATTTSERPGSWERRCAAAAICSGSLPLGRGVRHGPVVTQTVAWAEAVQYVEFLQESPGLEDGHGLLEEGADFGGGGVDRALAVRALRCAAVGNVDGVAGFLVAVRSSGPVGAAPGGPAVGFGGPGLCRFPDATAAATAGASTVATTVATTAALNRAALTRNCWSDGSFSVVSVLTSPRLLPCSVPGLLVAWWVRWWAAVLGMGRRCAWLWW